MRDRIQDTENQRAAAKAWGTEPEEYSLGELFTTFCGIALVLSSAALAIYCIFGEA